MDAKKGSKGDDVGQACHFNYERMMPGLKDEKLLLEGAGVKHIDDLFSDIPAKVRIDTLDIPEALAECELSAEMKKLLGVNKTSRELLSFLGAGCYSVYIPAVVRAVTSRSEFYTAYTPYQAEVSQGMLQTLWEFQSMMCELTGMETTNTSMYDGATAMAEAALMSVRQTKKNEVLIASNVHWEKRGVVNTFCRGPGVKVKEVPFNTETGTVDLGALKAAISNDTAGFIVSNPNFFGAWEEAAPEMKSMLGDALLIVDANPLSLGIAKAPGDYGADIVVGEGQPLGNGMSLGGPSFGILTTRKKYIRDMPGRLIGMTKDAEGRRAFCMTLQTREQHIRRAKATSNICSNEALCSIAAATYLAALGRNGLRKLGIGLATKARKLAERLHRVPGIEPAFKSSHFNEFVVRSKHSLKTSCANALKHNVIPGLRLKPHYPELGEALLVAVAEGHSDADIERLALMLTEVVE